MHEDNDVVNLVYNNLADDNLAQFAASSGGAPSTRLPLAETRAADEGGLQRLHVPRDDHLALAHTRERQDGWTDGTGQ